MTKLLGCPFCGSPAMADSGFAPAESIIYAFCSSSDCRLHSVDVGLSPEEWNQRALPAINPQPPTVAITWHDSPESVHRAMWEESAVAAGMTYAQMVDESVSCGEDEHGNEIEFTHEQEIAGMRRQGCWAFVDARSNMIHAWADESASREFVLHMLAHEIGHITGDAHTDDFQEEMRAEQFGRVARAAYRLLPSVTADYAALEAENGRLPAAGSDVEEVEVVGYRVSMPGEPELGAWLDEEAESEPQIQAHEPLMTVAQHERIVAALSAQQSAHVSVPRDIALALLDDGPRAETWAAQAKLRALLNGGEA